MPLLSNYWKDLLMFSQISVAIVMSGENMEMIFQAFFKQHRWEEKTWSSSFSFFIGSPTIGHSIAIVKLFTVLSLVLTKLE